MNFVEKTRALLMPLKQKSIRRTLFVSVQRMKDLTFRLAEPSDFEKVVKLSEGLYGGHDYLPVVFHQWLTFDNSAIMLALDSDKPIGLLACLVVDEGKTTVRCAGRVVPGYRGLGVLGGLVQGLDDFVQVNFPNVYRERHSMYTGQIPSSKDIPWRKIAEFDALYYNVEEKTSPASKPASDNTLEIESCTKEFFSDVILSPASTPKLFANNLLVVDRIPFEPLRSNIDLIFSEHDMHLFVEKGAKACPRSFSHGFYAQRVDAVEWLATFHTDDPDLFKAHLLRHFQRACEVIQGKFSFFTFQNKSMTPLARSVLGNTLQLKEVDVDIIGNAPLGVFERDFMRLKSFKS